MYKKYILLLIGFMLQWQLLWAVMAYPYPVEVEQPDGSRLEIRQYGDEFFHYATDREGYLIAQKKDGFYYYSDFDVQGKLNIGNYRAGTYTTTRSTQVPEINITRAAMSKNSRIEESRHLTKANASQAFEGRLKTIVLLVAFADKAFVSSSAQDDFDRLKNELGYSDNGASGSLRDYYRDNSKGAFDPEFVVMGPYTLSKPMAYYGANDDKGSDSNPRRMILEAAWLADQDGVDFSEFDEDNDGYVDVLYVYYAGHNEAEGGPDASIWPHSWSVAGMDSSSLDGVQLGYYACSSELKGSAGTTMTAIGTACHEFAHTLGLMDMYDTDGAESGGRSAGLGSLSLMSAGNYNNQSRTPPYLTAEERWSLGWMTPEEISVGQYVLPSIDQNKAYVIHTENKGEFFLLENRQRSKWDTYIKGEGLLIYHVDKSDNLVLGKTALERWRNNSINVYPQHQCMDLEEACGLESRGDAYAFFPGYSGLYTEFTLSTIPSTMTWSGLPLGMEVYDISLEGDEIRFRVQKEEKVYFGGEVLNKQGQAVSGAVLYLKKLSEVPPASSVKGLRSAMKTSEVYYTTLSDGNGRFLFDEELSIGNYELLCQSEDYVGNSQIIELKQGSNDFSVVLMTETEQLIEGSLSWCTDFSYGGAIGNEGEAFMVGVSWTAEDLNEYADMYIGRMTFFIAGGNPEVEVYIYSGGKLIYQQSVAAEQLAANAYCSLDLLTDSLLIEPGAELILAYEVSNYPSDKYPAGICSGPRVEGKGNLISLDKGASWTTLYQAAEIEGNWLISFDICRGSDFVQMESFSLDPGELTMIVGETHHLFAQVKPLDATNWRINWKSSDTSIVYVDQLGKLSAMFPGQATITASTDNGNRSAGCLVLVNPTIRHCLDLKIAQHVFYMDWTDAPADSWRLSWRDTKDSVYQDTLLTQRSFLLAGLSPGSSTEVLLRAYLGEEEVDRYEGTIVTADKNADFMAMSTEIDYSPGDILLLDVLNMPEDASVLVWKLNDEIISGSLLELPQGIHELKVEVNTLEGREIIRRQLKVE